jgi:hypothetical protein
MPYYDDRDYFYNAENIDELYDNSDDSLIFEEEDSDWEYDYHNIANELVDD